MLDPDTAAAQELHRQLQDLGFNPLTIAEIKSAQQLCQAGGVQAVLSASVTTLNDMGVLPAGTASIYVSQPPLELDDVLLCLQAGVQDCWQLPMSDAEMRSRLGAVLMRMEQWVAGANAELLTMRTELERDQRAGQYIQLGMLPPNPMGIGHFRLQHRVEPSLILSGDFVDYFQITDRHFACYVADVAGHGASSAFVTVLLKNFSRRLRREYRLSMLRQPGEVLTWINNELIDQQIDKHVAMFFGVVDVQDSRLYYANAAHFPPAMLVGDDGVINLEQKGKPLGIFENTEFQSQAVDFPRGARVVVFSDGVLDLIHADSLEAKERQLLETVRQCQDMESLWDCFDTTKLGQDDISCLMISHEY